MRSMLGWARYGFNAALAAAGVTAAAAAWSAAVGGPVCWLAKMSGW